MLDKATRTRELVECSGYFALQLPTKSMVSLTIGVGTDSAKDVSDKLGKYGVRTFPATENGPPLVEGCVGWVACRLVREPHNQQVYDLFIGDVTGPGQMIVCSATAAGTLMTHPMTVSARPAPY